MTFRIVTSKVVSPVIECVESYLTLVFLNPLKLKLPFSQALSMTEIRDKFYSLDPLEYIGYRKFRVSVIVKRGEV